MNKSGALGNQLHLFSFFILLGVVAVAIVLGHGIYFGNGYDTREIKAEALNYQIVDCINKNGFDNLLNNCGFNEDVFEDEGFILRVCKDKCNSNDPVYFKGSNYQSCGFNTVDISYPKCYSSNIEFEGDKYEVITGANRIPRRQE